MTTKRALLKKLTEHLGNPQELRLTAQELEELIDLLGGSTRPRHRPKVLSSWGERARTIRARFAASAVFEAMRNDNITRAEAIRRLAVFVANLYMAPKPADAASMKMHAKRIENEIDWLRNELGLKRLGPDEWEVYLRQTNEAMIAEMEQKFAKLLNLSLPGALKNQVQHFWEKMLHGKNLPAVEY